MKREAGMKRALLGAFYLVVAMTTASSQDSPNDPLIARAKSLELDTPYRTSGG
jgi:hypothetical protein